MVTAMATLLLIGYLGIFYVAGQKQDAESYLHKEEPEVVNLMHNAPWRRTPTPARSATAADITTTRRVLGDPRPPRTDASGTRTEETTGRDGDERNRHTGRSRSRPRAESSGAAEAGNNTEPGLSMRPPRPSCPNPELPAAAQPTGSQPDPLNIQGWPGEASLGQYRLLWLEIFELVTSGQGDDIQNAEMTGIPVHEQAWRLTPWVEGRIEALANRLTPAQIAVALAGLQDSLAYVSAIATDMLLQSMEANEQHHNQAHAEQADDYEDVPVEEDGEPESPEPEAEDTALMQNQWRSRACSKEGLEEEVVDEMALVQQQPRPPFKDERDEHTAGAANPRPNHRRVPQAYRELAGPR